MVAPDRERQLATAFVEIADALVSDFDAADLLYSLVGHCVDLLELEAAALMLGDAEGHLRVVASSTERTRLLKLFQLETSAGPCLDCFQSGKVVCAPDLSAEADHWPLFTERARRDGYAAVYALPMRLRAQMIGALNLFAAAAQQLGDDDLRVAQALADLATIGLLHERAVQQSTVVVEQLQEALDDRMVIEQAKGLVAEAGGLDMDEAFARLRRFARRSSSRLAEVARGLLDGTVSSAAVVHDEAPPSLTAVNRRRAPRPTASPPRSEALVESAEPSEPGASHAVDSSRG